MTESTLLIFLILSLAVFVFILSCLVMVVNTLNDEQDIGVKPKVQLFQQDTKQE